jgi:hypothetical protein
MVDGDLVTTANGIDGMIESTSVRAIRERLDEFDFSADESVAVGGQ